MEAKQTCGRGRSALGRQHPRPRAKTGRRSWLSVTLLTGLVVVLAGCSSADPISLDEATTAWDERWRGDCFAPRDFDNPQVYREAEDPDFKCRRTKLLAVTEEGADVFCFTWVDQITTWLGDDRYADKGIEKQTFCYAISREPFGKYTYSTEIVSTDIEPAPDVWPSASTGSSESASPSSTTLTAQWDDWASVHEKAYQEALTLAARGAERIEYGLGDGAGYAVGDGLDKLVDAGRKLASIPPSPRDDVNSALDDLTDTLKSAQFISDGGGPPYEPQFLASLSSLASDVSSDLAALRQVLDQQL